MSKTLSSELQWRGLIKDKTFEDISWLDTPQRFYLGADVGSSDSLTIGNLAIYVMARRLINAGWQPIMLVGGATSLIGDPGGKSQERDLVSREQVEHNKAAIAAQVKRLLDIDNLTLVDNYEWFKEIGYLDFLRDVGKHYSMTELLQRDYIADRIGVEKAGISYAEFSYSLIQGYDFWHLYKNYDVVLQIGGSDQWGNMLSGVPLVRKKENAEVHAMSMPLVINKLTGAKFGKSEDGAVWLDPKKTSPYQFYQFWLNVDDQGVEDYLKIYTFLSQEDIAELMAQFAANPGERAAQKRLAYEVTKLVHGEDVAEKQQKISTALFVTREFEGFGASEFMDLERELPFAEVSEGATYVDVLLRTNLVQSSSEARRLIEQGGVSNAGFYTITEWESEVSKEDSLDGYQVIIKGKKHIGLIKIV